MLVVKKLHNIRVWCLVISTKKMLIEKNNQLNRMKCVIF